MSLSQSVEEIRLEHHQRYCLLWRDKTRAEDYLCLSVVMFKKKKGDSRYSDRSQRPRRRKNGMLANGQTQHVSFGVKPEEVEEGIVREIFFLILISVAFCRLVLSRNTGPSFLPLRRTTIPPSTATPSPTARSIMVPSFTISFIMVPSFAISFLNFFFFSCIFSFFHRKDVGFCYRDGCGVLGRLKRCW